MIDDNEISSIAPFYSYMDKISLSIGGNPILNIIDDLQLDLDNPIHTSRMLSNIDFGESRSLLSDELNEFMDNIVN